MTTFGMTCLYFDPKTKTCEAEHTPCTQEAIEFALNVNATRGRKVVDCVEASPVCFNVIPRGEVEEAFAFIRGEPMPRSLIVEEE